MASNLSKKYWKNALSEVLRIICGCYSITAKELSENFGDSAGANKWLKGTRSPNAESQKHILEVLTRIAKEDKSEATYALLCEQFENCLCDIGLSSVRKIEKNANCDSAELIAGVLRLCFLNIGRTHTLEKKKLKSNVEDGKGDFCGYDKKTRAVIFDFDGTLTTGKLNRTTWEDLWKALDYDVNLCKYYHQQFNDGIIDHPKWCKITEEYFKKRNLHRQTVEAIASNIKLLPGVEEVLNHLNENDIKVYIVSGSILHVIKAVLGFNYTKIDGIKANIFFFNVNGFLDKIKGTKYDFEGKADFIDELTDELGISPKEVLFVGNSINDEFAYRSGARTLCINPKNTDFENKTVWNECIQNCTDLRQILEYVKI